MPFNLTIGSTATFTVNFFDQSGNPVVPSSATLTITYTPAAGGAPVSTSVGLSAAGNYFVGSWATNVAAAGAASVSATAPGQLTVISASLRLRN